MSQSRELSGNCSLERALQALVEVFHQYSVRGGERDLLEPGEFGRLLREQAPTFLSACDRGQPGYLERLFQDSDASRDRALSFPEFSAVLGRVAGDAHRLGHGWERCGPERD